MTNSQEQSRLVVLVSLIVVWVVLIACSTVACQSTPTESVVVGKNDDQLDRIIEGTPAPTIDVKSGQQKEIWQEKLTGTNVTVNVDAEIIWPNASQFPVVEVEPKVYTEDDAWDIVHVFFKVAEVYDEPIFTKEVLEAQIITLKKELADIQNGVITGDIDSIKDEIDYYIKMMESAASEDDKTQAQTDLTFNEQNGQQRINISANIENNGYPATLMISMNNSEYNTGIYFSNRTESLTTHSVDENKMVMTLDEAIVRVQNTMSDLGMKDRVLIESDIEGVNDEQGYMLYFASSINGMGVMNYQTHVMKQAEGESSNYAPFLRPEQVSVYINDNGILKFYLSNALQMGDVLNENVNILSIDEIKNIFGEQVFYNYFATEDDPLTIDIKQIELGYFVQSVKEQPGVFRAIPVWDFLATEDAFEGDAYVYSVLTINAIDGSILNRNLGY